MNERKSPAVEQPFDSLDMDPDLFRRLGYEVIDAIAHYYSTIRERRIISESSSAEIEQVFAEALPLQGQDPGRILDEWQQKVLPHATHLGSPRYFGFVNGSGTMIAVLADALAASVNMNAGGWKAGPAATEVERRAIAWIAELIGYPTTCGGLFLGGGTIANFSALLTALRNTAAYDTTAGGAAIRRAQRGIHPVHVGPRRAHLHCKGGRHAQPGPQPHPAGAQPRRPYHGCRCPGSDDRRG